MTLPNLATVTDAVSLGYSLPADTADALLKRASVRVRRAAGFPITQVTTTMTVWSDGRIDLPPLTTDVSGVTQDGLAVDFDQMGQWLCTPCGLVSVSLTMGFATLPDGLVELTCSLANRMQDDDPSAALMLQQEMVGQTMRLWKVGAEEAASDMSKAELRALRYCVPDVRAWVVRCI